MTENITEFLLEHFPERDELSYEDFTRAGDGDIVWKNDTIRWYAYDDDQELAERAFRVISRPWPEIDWFEIQVGSGSVPMSLNKKSFIHAFPSLLNYLYILKDDKYGIDLAGNFADQLDLKRLRDVEKEVYGDRKVFDWKREFYASFSNDIKQVICKILVLRCEEYALASYWGRFAEVNMIKYDLGMSNLDLKITVDLFLACAAAKDEFNQQCFAGRDTDIQEQIDHMLDAAQGCEKLIKRKAGR